jgi:hypothetical protein
MVCPGGAIFLLVDCCFSHTHKSKDRVTETPLKIGGELRCSGRVGSSHKNILFCTITFRTVASLHKINLELGQRSAEAYYRITGTCASNESILILFYLPSFL